LKKQIWPHHVPLGHQNYEIMGRWLKAESPQHLAIFENLLLKNAF